jgi:sugar-specific transcriptional regulator TrmB
MSPDYAQPLVSLGFTALEADVYFRLLEEPASTGYRIARALGKPAPNIYKALESLHGKGAVIVDEGATRVCRAVPPDELLGQLERRFHENRERAARSLAERPGAQADDRVYRLSSTEQVFERARAMIARATRIVLVDAFPEPLGVLRAELERSAAAGVEVAILAYAPVEIAGARVIENPLAPETRSRWPGQWVNVVVDGREHLVSFLGRDGRSVHQAIWSGSPYLSWVYHSSLSSEVLLAEVRRMLDRGASADELRVRLDQLASLRATEAPGYQELVRVIGDPNHA